MPAYVREFLTTNQEEYYYARIRTRISDHESEEYYYARIRTRIFDHESEEYYYARIRTRISDHESKEYYYARIRTRIFDHESEEYYYARIRTRIFDHESEEYYYARIRTRIFGLLKACADPSFLGACFGAYSRVPFDSAAQLIPPRSLSWSDVRKVYLCSKSARVCADNKLNAAAVAEGFVVENPNDY